LYFICISCGKQEGGRKEEEGRREEGRMFIRAVGLTPLSKLATMENQKKISSTNHSESQNQEVVGKELRTVIRSYKTPENKGTAGN
jgi:hypothetical protein